jgi:hypothetical protein
MAKPKTNLALALSVPENVHRMLDGAALRRGLPIEDLAAGLLGAVMCKCSVDELMQKFDGWAYAGHPLRDYELQKPRYKRKRKDGAQTVSGS